MSRLIILATVVALAVAKPELYKETEDFQYSRSSSDEGTKSGTYGAQRGNMGGNYERAHNMDTLAQHQMGGLVNQVHGELGDASKAKTGNIFAAANSRGMYGSGHYDLSNLQGRNFQEGASYADSMSEGQSSAFKHSAASQNFVHAGDANYRRYTGQTGQHLVNANDAENLYSNNYGRNQDAASSYYSQSGYQGQKVYERGSSNQYATSGQDSDIRTRLINTRPIKIVVRPGSTVAVPLAAQTYDSTHRRIGSVYDQDTFNRETEDLNSIDNTKTIINPNKAKHYESSYSYQKEWEKQDTKPVAVPLGIQTENPLVNERHISGALDSESHVNRASGYQAARLSNSHNSYNTKSSQALHHSGYNAQNFVSDSQAYKHGLDIEKANQDALAATLAKNQPSNYQSSYSYHKAWERQGDPYVIEPASYNQQTQRLTDASNSASAISSNRYLQNHKGYHKSSQITEDCDCDQEQGHIRMRRSYNQKLSQQSQNLEDLGQQTQNIEDLGQLNQGHWENLDDLAQQTQQQQNQWSDLQDLGQQSQSQWGNLDDLGQQSQPEIGYLDGLGQQLQSNDELEQQLQNNWAIMHQNTGQQTETNWNNVEQKVQGQWTVSNDHAKHINTESSTFTGPNIPTIYHSFEIDRNVHKNKWHSNQNIQSENHFPTQGEPQVFWNNYPQQNFYHNIDNLHTGNHQIQTIRQSSDKYAGSVFNEQAEMPLNNLWNKINNLDKDSVSFNQNTVSKSKDWWHSHDVKNRTNSNSKTTTEVTTTTAKITKQDEFRSHWHSVDVGRGDIGSDDESVFKSTEKITTFNSQQTYNEEKKTKTPEEIETLSLTKPTLNTKNDSWNDTQIDESLKVLSLTERRNNNNTNRFEDLNENVVELQNKRHEKEHSAESLFTQQNENLDQQSIWSHGLDKLSTQNMKNVEDLPDFGQKADSLYQQSSWRGNSAENGHEQQLVQFNSPRENNNFEQQSQSIWEENLQTQSQQKHDNVNFDQQSQSTWGETQDQNHKNVNLEQQSQSNWEDHKDQNHQKVDVDQHQHSINLEQQSQSTWADLESPHEKPKDQIQQRGNLEHQRQSMGGENLESQKDKSQEQQTLNLEQQSSPTWMELESQSHQKYENTDQQLTDLTQQIENLEQQFQTADQLENFYHHEKVKDLPEFTQQNENLSQNIEKQNQNKFEQTDHHHKLSIWGSHVDKLSHQDSNNPKELDKNADTYEENQHHKRQHEKSDQDTVDWGQQTEDLTQQNIQQQNQDDWEHLAPAQQFPHDKQRLLVHDKKIDDVEIPSRVADVELILPESTTAKPGFWKSVGSKFVNAKDKVATWFHKSK